MSDSVVGPPSSRDVVPAAAWRACAWAGAWFAVAIAGIALWVTDWSSVIDGDVAGQRTWGIIVFTPLLAAAIAVLCIVTGVRRSAAWRRHSLSHGRAHARAQRRAQLAAEPWVPLVLGGLAGGVIWLVGVVGLGVFIASDARNATGFWLAVMLLMLLAMAWIPLLAVGVERRAARGAPRH